MAGVHDNLGNHIATQNVQLGSHYVSGDGDGEGIYVDSDGKVGIGTNNPLRTLDVSSGVIVANAVGIGTIPSYSLDVDGTVNATAYLGDGSQLDPFPGDDLGDHVATENIQLGTYYLSGDGDNEGIYVNSFGDVGIGTNSPQGRLHIYAQVSPDLRIQGIADNNVVQPMIEFAENASGLCRIQIRYLAGSDQLRFTGGCPSPIDIMTVERGGDIGIGTTEPNATLHVVGEPTMGKIIIAPSELTADDNSQLFFAEEDDGDIGMYFEYYGLSDQLHLYGKFNSTTYGPHLSVHRNSGNVGIGSGYASSNRQLFVKGSSDDEYAGYFECIDTVNDGYGIKATCNEIGGATHYGVYGGAYGASTNYGGYFAGDVHVTGNLSKVGVSFKIDHPLDPENKYLYHSFVEPPDMKNIYDGIVILDINGEAVVLLPEWFGALNRDFRYQLTAIGAPGPNLYVAEEISGNQFKIAGGEAGMKVSWQLTGIRQDAWANDNRIPVEEDKPADQKGLYLTPESFGKSETLGIDYVHMMEMEQQSE